MARLPGWKKKDVRVTLFLRIAVTRKETTTDDGKLLAWRPRSRNICIKRGGGRGWGLAGEMMTGQGALNRPSCLC